MVDHVSNELKCLSKWCAVLSILVVIYPLVLLVPEAGYPFDFLSGYAISTTHIHLAGNTLLFFMVGFLFTFTKFDRAKKVWPSIGAVALIAAMAGLFFGMLPLIIIGYSVFAICILVMAVGILAKT